MALLTLHSLYRSRPRTAVVRAHPSLPDGFAPSAFLSLRHRAEPPRHAEPHFESTSEGLLSGISSINTKPPCSADPRGALTRPSAPPSLALRSQQRKTQLLGGCDI